MVHRTGDTPSGRLTRIQAVAGSHGTRGLTLLSSRENTDASLAAQAAVHTLISSGFHGLEEGQRGAVDRRLGLATRSADFRIVWRPDNELTIEPFVS